MTTFQAIVMAVLQGVTELFPISSLGHAVHRCRGCCDWPIDQKAPDFLPYLVVMHLGTAIALFLYFWRDWLAFLQLARRCATRRARAADRRIFGLVVLATIPAVVVGFVLHKLLGDAFGSPPIAAFFLIVNGVDALFRRPDRRRRRRRARPAQLEGRAGDRRRAMLRPDPRFFALGPDDRGRNRSPGSKHEDSARFSFLMATPIILGATVLEAPKLLKSGATLGGASIVSGVVAGVVAYVEPRLSDALFPHPRVQRAEAVLLLLRGGGARRASALMAFSVIAPLGAR